MPPIYVVYLFIFLNLFLNFLGFDQGFLQLPFLVCLVIFIFSDLRFKLGNPIMALHLWIISISAVFFLVQQFLSKGFVVFQGGLNIVLCTYFFYTWLSTRSNHHVQLRFYLNLIKFLLIFLFLEFIIMIFGFQSALKIFFPGYKLYNPFDTQTLFGLSNVGGSNSLFLGSQIAGTIALVASLIFFYLYKSEKKNYLFWFLLSFFLFIINLNGTNFLLLFFILLISYPKSSVWAKVTMFSCGILLVYLTIKLSIFERFFQEDANSWVVKNTGMSSSEYYVYAFLSPVYFFFRLDMSEVLFGVGADQYSILGKNLAFESDFGFFVSVILKNGLIWTFILLLYLSRIFKYSGVTDSFNLKYVLKLSILTLLFSSFHYAQILLNLSVTVFFSYLLAVYLIYPDLNQNIFKSPRKFNFEGINK